MKNQRNTTSNRPARMASTVQTMVAQILHERFGDDGLLGGVSLVGATARGGTQFVHLYYYSHNSDIAAVQRRLDEVTKTIRYELASRLNQKYVPDIKFEYDDTLDRAERLDKILKNL